MTSFKNKQAKAFINAYSLKFKYTRVYIKNTCQTRLAAVKKTGGFQCAEMENKRQLKQARRNTQKMRQGNSQINRTNLRAPYTRCRQVKISIVLLGNPSNTRGFHDAITGIIKGTGKPGPMYEIWRLKCSKS